MLLTKYEIWWEGLDVNDKIISGSILLGFLILAVVSYSRFQYFKKINSILNRLIHIVVIKIGQRTVDHGDGQKYIGQVKDNMANGQGTMTYSDGSKYVGEWKDDRYNGQGTMTYSDGREYVGEFKDDIRTGKGTMTYANKYVYTGEWKDNERNGKGEIVFTYGNVYIGYWINDRLTYNGTLRSVDGKRLHFWCQKGVFYWNRKGQFNEPRRTMFYGWIAKYIIREKNLMRQFFRSAVIIFLSFTYVKVYASDVEIRKTYYKSG